MLASNSAFCGKKKLRFIKYEEVSRLWSKFEIKIPLSIGPLIGDILF